jgi:hypothetical protein
VNINLDAIFEPARKGVARGYTFAGFAINAANDPRLTEFHLRSKASLRFLPDPTSPGLLASHKKKFAIWALGNGFREAMEAFGVTLDRIYEACLAADEAAQGREGRADPKALETFRGRAGIYGKVRTLREKFQLETSIPDDFRSLNLARNCLSHRRGIVGEQDCNEDGQLVLRFLTMELSIAHADGRETRVDEKALESGGVYVGAGGGMLQARVVEHRLPFQVGSILTLTPENMGGLFFSIMNAIQCLQGGFVKRIEALNVKAGGQRQG